MTIDTILHIGLGKTGTSSLQTFLSENPVLSSDAGQSYEYCVVRKDGSIWGAESVLEHLDENGLGYLTSTLRVKSLIDFDPWRSAIASRARKNIIPIFSQEDWCMRGNDFASQKILAQLDCNAHVIMYIKPQVNFFNSGWWQWWAWCEQFKSPSDVLFSWGFDFLNWEKLIRHWERMDNVKKITIRLQPVDVVSDFCKTLGIKSCETTKAYRVNESLSQLQIKIIMTYPKLRLADSAHIDKFLQEHFPISGKTPWIITEELATTIIDACKDGNNMIINRLDEESRKAMREDGRWWDAGAFPAAEPWKRDDYKLKAGDYRTLLETFLNWKIHKT